MLIDTFVNLERFLKIIALKEFLPETIIFLSLYRELFVFLTYTLYNLY